MIEESCRALRSERPQIRRAGLLAAAGTVKSRIYETVFARDGVEVVAPDEADQARVHAAIQDVKAGGRGAGTAGVLYSAGAALVARGAEAVILGCTEIPLVFDPMGAGYPTINPTRVLAQAAIAWALGERP